MRLLPQKHISNNIYISPFLLVISYSPYYWLVGYLYWQEEICRMRLRNPGSGLCVHRQVWVPEEGSSRAHCCGFGSYWDSESTWTNWRIAGSLAVSRGEQIWTNTLQQPDIFLKWCCISHPIFQQGPTSQIDPDRQSHFFHMDVVFANKNLAALCFSQKIWRWFFFWIRGSPSSGIWCECPVVLKDS